MSFKTEAVEPEPRSLSQRPLLFALIWGGVALVFLVQAVAIDLIPFLPALGFCLTDWLPWMLLSPLVLRLGERFELTQASWPRRLPLHLFACLLIAVASELAFHHLFEAFMRDRMPPSESRWVPGGTEPRNRPPPRFMLIPRAKASIPIYWILILAAHASAHQRRSAKRERRALRAEAGLVEARLAVLQAQLNPHFLFNTLNTIAGCIRDEPAVAERMVESLGEMMRAVLATSERRLVPLREELALANSFLSIQETRFRDRLEVRRDFAAETLGLAVPPLLLQPIIENAFIHGLSKSRHPGTLELSSRLEAGRLVLELSNVGPGQPTPVLPLREGTGLTNTRERLSVLYPGSSSLTLEPLSQGGLKVVVSMPAEPYAST